MHRRMARERHFFADEFYAEAAKLGDDALASEG
jgi:hypothetical protein